MIEKGTTGACKKRQSLQRIAKAEPWRHTFAVHVAHNGMVVPAMCCADVNDHRVKVVVKVWMPEKTGAKTRESVCETERLVAPWSHC